WEQINGPACISVGLEHDSTIPPLGKVLAAEIHDRSDEVTELIVTQEIFERESRLTLPDGTMLFKAESDSDRRPFRMPDADDQTALYVDPNSFPSGDTPGTFFDSVAAETGSGAFLRHTHFRKAFMPDPELVISLGKLAVGAFLG